MQDLFFKDLKRQEEETKYKEFSNLQNIDIKDRKSDEYLKKHNKHKVYKIKVFFIIKL